MSEEDNNAEQKMKLVFAPGCFDSFEGSQEELDELVAHIQQMFESGELFEGGEPVDLDDLDEEDAEALAKIFVELEGDAEPRKLN